jgi:IS1 family transposase
MNKLSVDKKVAVVTALVEGCSVRSTSRLTGAAKGTIPRILEEVGTACAAFQDAVIRNVKAERVQVDEIWSFVGCKQKNVTVEKMERALCGDAWTFAAIEAQSKLVICWLVGRRDAGCATEFLQDVASRLANRVQLTTDGHKMYLTAVVDAFADDIDYAQLVKVFGNDPERQKRTARRNVLGPRKKPSSVRRIRRTSAPAISSAKTSR